MLILTERIVLKKSRVYASSIRKSGTTFAELNKGKFFCKITSSQTSMRLLNEEGRESIKIVLLLIIKVRVSLYL